MNRLQPHLWKLTFIVCICLMIPLAVAQEQSDEAFIQYRQKVMTSHGASMGAISDIIKNKLPYQSHLFTHAQDIQRMSTLIPEAFKKQITDGKTDAKPEIWKEWSKFTAASDDLGKAAAELAKVAKGGNMEAVNAQVKKVGDACGQCHKPYRKPKEESYKSKS